jgi:hypothetical protein
LIRLRHASTVAIALAAFAVTAHAQGSGALVVNTNPPGAEVSVDGKAVGRSPTSVYSLAAGDHLVEVKFRDGYTTSVVGTVIAGQSVVVKIDNPNAPPPSSPRSDEEAPPPRATGEQQQQQQADSQRQPNEAQPLQAETHHQQEGAAASSGNAVVGGDAQNPHKHGLEVAPGVACFGGTDCNFRLRAALDFFIGDAHITGVFGPTLNAGVLVGAELGTPYFQLGSKASPVALAARASIDLGGGVLVLSARIPGGGTVSETHGTFLFTNTYGPNLSVMLSEKIALEARFAVGWYAAAADNTVTGFYFDSWVGVRFQL